MVLLHMTKELFPCLADTYHNRDSLQEWMEYAKQQARQGGGGISTTISSNTLRPNLSIDKGLTSLLTKKEKESYKAEEAPKPSVADSVVTSLFSSTTSGTKYSSSRGGKKGKLFQGFISTLSL